MRFTDRLSLCACSLDVFYGKLTSFILTSSQVKRMEMEQKDCSLKVEKLIEKHAWIASEKQLFGRSGTDYDFGSRDPRDARETFEKLQADQSG